MTQFVTEKDIIILKKNEIDYETDIKLFLKEIREYFTEVWQEKYINELTNLEDYSIEHFNKVIGNWPSWAAYHILEDSFCFGPTEILSIKSKSLLGYFYGIHLH